MRIRKKPWAEEYIEQKTNLFINSYVENKIEMDKLFNKYQRIELEIGCGKGSFIIEKAKKNPKILFIAIEKYTSIIGLAARKAERENIENLKFFCTDIVKLEENENFINKIDKIYLNFSDPWPKKRHAKRRLTSPNFLKIYKILLTKNGEIEQKTDNDNLFEYSVTTIANDQMFEIKELFLDLHSHEKEIDNIRTEYEEKFSNKGYKIKYLKAQRKDL